MLTLKNIHKAFGETQVLKGTSLVLESGLNFIVGPSGSGKTTLLKIIAGLDKNYDGNVFYNGKAMKEFTDQELESYYHSSVGFVWQNFQLLNHLSVEDNVKIALELSNMSESEKNDKVAAILGKLKIRSLGKKNISKLSGGQKQRVAIARALVKDPEIIIADEPTGDLDKQSSKVIIDLLKEIAKERLVVIVTHDKSLITDKDNCFLLKNKEITQVGKVKESTSHKKPKETSTKPKLTLPGATRLASRNFKGQIGKFVLTSFVMTLSAFFVILGTNGSVTSEQQQILNDLLEERGAHLRDISVPTNAISGVGGNSESQGNVDIDQDVSEVLATYKDDERLEYIMPTMVPNNIVLQVDGVVEDYQVQGSNTVPNVNELLAGSMPKHDNREVAVNQTFLKNNNLEPEDVIGKTMALSAEAYDWTSGQPVAVPIQLDNLTIVGVVDSTLYFDQPDGSQLVVEQEDAFIYGLDVAKEVRVQTNSDVNSLSFTMRVKEIEDVIAIVNELRAQGITPLGQFEEIESLVNLDETTEQQTGFISSMMTILGSVGFLAVIIINGYIRKREVAILKSNGFSNKNIFSVNFVETLMMTVIAIVLFMVTIPTANQLSQNLLNMSISETGVTGYTLVVFSIGVVVMAFVSVLIARNIDIQKYLLGGDK